VRRISLSACPRHFWRNGGGAWRSGSLNRLSDWNCRQPTIPAGTDLNHQDLRERYSLDRPALSAVRPSNSGNRAMFAATGRASSSVVPAGHSLLGDEEKLGGAW
jgi:hypothetical protein